MLQEKLIVEVQINEVVILGSGVNKKMQNDKPLISGSSFKNGIEFSMNKIKVKVCYKENKIMTEIKHGKTKKWTIYVLIMVTFWILSVIMTELSYVVSLLGILIYLINMRFLNTSKYHGAEHKVINAYEQDLDLNFENVKGQSRISNHCGVNTVLYFTIFLVPAIFFVHNLIGDFVYSFIIVSIYFIKNSMTDILFRPIELLGAMIQRCLSTREPEEDQINLAIIGISKLLSLQ